MGSANQPSFDKRGRVIRASELGQYQYCARAWWLNSIMGMPSTNLREMEYGEKVHQRHGRVVWLAGVLKVAAILLALLAVAALLRSL